MKREREEEDIPEVKRSCVEEEQSRQKYDKIVIYTDGSCIKTGNKGTGPGGWAAIVQFYHEDRLVEEIILKKGVDETTSNIMELKAAIASLKHVDQKLERNVPVTLTTDSTYVKNGITQWINNWKKNGWKTANRKDVKNQKLWVALDKYRSSIEKKNNFPVEFNWTKAHIVNGDPNNKRVDKLARGEATIVKNTLEK